jgi:hypothetical protein
MLVLPFFSIGIAAVLITTLPVVSDVITKPVVTVFPADMMLI